MNRYLMLVFVLALMPSLASADNADANDDEVMMSVVGSQEANEQQFVDEIALPSQGASRGGQDAGIGDKGENGALDQGDMAAEARERAQENARHRASEARATARESRDARQRARDSGRTSPNGPDGGGPSNGPGNGNPPPNPGNP